MVRFLGRKIIDTRQPKVGESFESGLFRSRMELRLNLNRSSKFNIRRYTVSFRGPGTRQGLNDPPFRILRRFPGSRGSLRCYPDEIPASREEDPRIRLESIISSYKRLDPYRSVSSPERYVSGSCTNKHSLVAKPIGSRGYWQRARPPPVDRGVRSEETFVDTEGKVHSLTEWPSVIYDARRNVSINSSSDLRV